MRRSSFVDERVKSTICERIITKERIAGRKITNKADLQKPKHVLPATALAAVEAATTLVSDSMTELNNTKAPTSRRRRLDFSGAIAFTFMMEL